MNFSHILRSLNLDIPFLGYNFFIFLFLNVYFNVLFFGYILNCLLLAISLSHFYQYLFFVLFYRDSNLLKVVTGGIPETTELLELRFDYIFFTGSATVGKPLIVIYFFIGFVDPSDISLISISKTNFCFQTTLFTVNLQDIVKTFRIIEL